MSTWDSDTIRKLHQDNKLLQDENDKLYIQLMQVCNENETLRIQLQDLKFELNSERALFNKLTLLEEPPRGDDDTTLFDIKPASGE